MAGSSVIQQVSPRQFVVSSSSLVIRKTKILNLYSGDYRPKYAALWSYEVARHKRMQGREEDLYCPWFEIWHEGGQGKDTMVCQVIGWEAVIGLLRAYGYPGSLRAGAIPPRYWLTERGDMRIVKSIEQAFAFGAHRHYAYWIQDIGGEKQVLMAVQQVSGNGGDRALGYVDEMEGAELTYSVDTSSTDERGHLRQTVATIDVTGAFVRRSTRNEVQVLPVRHARKAYVWDGTMEIVGRTPLLGDIDAAIERAKSTSAKWRISKDTIGAFNLIHCFDPRNTKWHAKEAFRKMVKMELVEIDD